MVVVVVVVVVQPVMRMHAAEATWEFVHALVINFQLYGIKLLFPSLQLQVSISYQEFRL